MADRVKVNTWCKLAMRGIWVPLLIWGGPAFAGEGAGSPPASVEGVTPLSGALMFETKALPLTRQDAIYLALLNSRDVRIERLAPDILETEIRRERAAFHPAFSLESSTTQSHSAAGTVLAGSTSPQAESVNWSSGVKAKLISGAVASLDFTNSRVESNSQFLTLNPQYSANLVFTLTQPLLKDFGPRINRTRIKLAQNNATISRYQLQSRIASVLADVENAYWELVLGFKDQDIRRKSLELSRRLAERSRELAREGFLPEIAALQAEAAVVQREGDVLAATSALKDTLGRLQDILNLDPTSDVQIVPVDQPTLEVPAVNLEQALKAAFARRPEMPQAELELKNRRMSLDFAKNQTLPQLNLFFSYGLSGLAGTSRDISPVPSVEAFLAQKQIPPPSLVGGYGTALDNLFSGDFPTWKIGVNLTVPLGNVAAENQLRKANLEVQKASLTVKDVERKIALEVERLARQIQTLRKAIDGARALREQTGRRLEMAQEQFELGLAPMTAVLDAQRDMATAEREEWRIVVDYNKALTLFDRATGATLQKYRVEF